MSDSMSVAKLRLHSKCLVMAVYMMWFGFTINVWLMAVHVMWSGF